MSRLRGNLPAYLQQCFGICRRTFERWCARGDVPGAYRTRGGHWRVRKASKAMIKSFILRPRAKTRRDQVGRAIISYPLNPSNSYLLGRIKRENAAIKFTLASYGITEEDIHDPKLHERDAEKHYILWEKSPPTRHPRAYEAINDSKHALANAAYMIRVNGRKVTMPSLARALRVSVSTLYRRYDRQEINRVCQEPPIHVVASVGKKNRKPILVLSELEINSPSQPHSSGASARSQTKRRRRARRPARGNS
jgi:hypothetical protein